MRVEVDFKFHFKFCCKDWMLFNDGRMLSRFFHSECAGFCDLPYFKSKTSTCGLFEGFISFFFGLFQKRGGNIFDPSWIGMCICSSCQMDFSSLKIVCFCLRDVEGKLTLKQESYIPRNE